MTSTFLDVQRALGRRAKGVIVRLSWKWEVDVLSLVTGHSRRDMRVIDNLANHMSGNHHADSRQDDCKHSYDKPNHACGSLVRSVINS